MSLDQHTLQGLTSKALDVARLAGECIVDVYKADAFQVDMKCDNTPVTTADLAAHDLIVRHLQQLTPQWPVLTEESDDISFEERQRWPVYWLVDPLDGTREFIRRNGEFSVNIALVHQHCPVAGVIVAPVLDLAYFATRDLGAYKQIAQQTPYRIHVRSAPPTVTVARSRSPKTGPRLKHFLHQLGTYDEITMGSALKSCLVAEGAADVYARLGPTGEWDTAAAQCIVEEAGGHIQDVYQRKLTYNQRKSLINPAFLVYGDDRVNWVQHLPSDAL